MTRATKKKRRETGNEREKTNERQLRAKKKNKAQRPKRTKIQKPFIDLTRQAGRHTHCEAKLALTCKNLRHGESGSKILRVTDFRTRLPSYTTSLSRNLCMNCRSAVTVCRHCGDGAHKTIRYSGIRKKQSQTLLMCVFCE